MNYVRLDQKALKIMGITKLDMAYYYRHETSVGSGVVERNLRLEKVLAKDLYIRGRFSSEGEFIIRLSIKGTSPLYEGTLVETTFKKIDTFLKK